MGKKSTYTLMQERINAHEQEHGQAFTAFLNNFNKEELAQKGLYGVASSRTSYELTNTIIEKGLDEIYLNKCLKNYESKGSLQARELLNERVKSEELNLSYYDLLQEFREELILMEQEELLGVKPREEDKSKLTIYCKVEELALSKVPSLFINGKEYKPVVSIEEYKALAMSNFWGCLFGRISKYMYAHKKRDKVHISYEIWSDIQAQKDDKEIIDFKNRKALAKHVSKNKLASSKEWSAFIKYVVGNTQGQKVQERRKSIIYGLLDGLTYKEISNKYDIPISTIGDNVKAIRAYYKDFFGVHNYSERHYTMSSYAKIIGYLDINKITLANGEKLQRGKKPVKTTWSALNMPYHIKLDFNKNYYSWSKQEELAQELQAQKERLAQELATSDIKPSKAKYEKSEKLYQYRHTSLCNHARARALAYERDIREELELLSKSQEPTGKIEFKRSAEKIQVLSGKTIIREYNIAKIS